MINDGDFGFWIDDFGLSHRQSKIPNPKSKMFFTISSSAYHAQLGIVAVPTVVAEAFVAGFFQVLEVLPQGILIELGQELGLGGDVVLANVLDELTFVHGTFTFLGCKFHRTVPVSRFKSDHPAQLLESVVRSGDHGQGIGTV
jgi:hypothetical protein